MSRQTRRQFLLAAGATATASVGVLGIGVTAGADSANQWQRVESPTTKTLHGVTDTAEGPFAVGSGGDVLARRRSGWQKVVEYGPQARSRPLTGVDVTDDGKRIWFVGGSGVIGEYDVETETLTNYSAPNEKTSTWEDVAVTGDSGGGERLYFVNGSGELLIGVRQSSGAIKYEDVIKPGGGSTIPGIDFHTKKNGHVTSTSQLVSETTSGGSKWEKIGIGFAGQNFFDVASVGMEDVNVAGGGGIVYRYDGFRWTPHVIDDGRQAIRAIDRDRDRGLAAGAGGKVYERRSAGQWRRFQTPVETKFRGVSHGRNGVDVAVGGGGTIVERTAGGDTTTATNTTATNGSDETSTSASTPTASSLSDAPKGVSEYAEGDWT